LNIQPVPEATVRVMVGRLEIMTPDREQKLETLLKTPGIEPSAPLDPASELGVELASLGRFAEPALTIVLKSSNDAEVRLHAERLIDLLVNGPKPPEEVKQESLPGIETKVAPVEAKSEAETDSN
jgi:hypothetical protein